jgi:hypothetical protein
MSGPRGARRDASAGAAPPHQAQDDLQDQPPNRWLAILYIVLCFELGVFLLLLPWVSLWARNFFVNRYEWVWAVAGNYFVRGAISGLGLADIFLAFNEAWRLRGAIGLAQTRSAR